LEFRTATLQDWHPKHRHLLITTRFADTAQLHLVKQPGGARHQLTFLPEPVAGGWFQPQTGAFIVLMQDSGGSEFYQFYRLELDSGRITLLTDGRSRNTGPRWSRSGRWLAYSSTRRTGRDTDVYVMDPSRPETDRCVCVLSGGGWSVLDWAPDDSRLLLRQYISINESRLELADVRTGARQALSPASSEKVAWDHAQCAPDGRAVFVTTDWGSEFLRLGRLDLATGRVSWLLPVAEGDIEAFELSPDGRLLAFVRNVEGASQLGVLDVRRGRTIRQPKLPAGVISRLAWHKDSRHLAFSLTSARTPTDVYVLDAYTGQVQRWTESETGGLTAERFAEPELIKLRSFDGLPISAWVYRPDPNRFSGRRPVLIQIHGGPEAQARPVFQGRYNYLVNELGVAVVYPNVRGSAGYGKTFLTLDNGLKREDAVKDLGAVLDWVARDDRLDADRVAVSGGSYGGYMALAALIQFGHRLRCGVDVVGIANFVTFLKQTQEYRRDLRRAEYGDERDPAMAAFLGRISPLSHADKITRALLVVQGQNDPRVPVTESEQMVRAIRARGGTVWYILARDEGHGFQKKPNADFQFLSTVLFLQQYLLK
jgi:dipeptidyl aminopeptidase/acylaminoacyl peptidase